MLVIIGFMISRPAHAQERGAIGAEVSAGFGVVDGSGVSILGAGGWYRLIPACAIGLNVGSATVNGFEQHGTEVDHYSFVEAVVDARGFPSSVVGIFGRVSAGRAHLTLLSPSTGPLYEEKRTEAILELEGGPELRVFFAPPSSRHRPDLFVRVRATLTTMSDATFAGLGLALGFEG